MKNKNLLSLLRNFIVRYFTLADLRKHNICTKLWKPSYEDVKPSNLKDQKEFLIGEQ